MVVGDDANTPKPNDEIEVTENKLLRDLLTASEASNKDFKALLEINRKLKDATVGQDALIKPIELISRGVVSFGAKVVESMIYLDKLSVSNSDISLNLVEMATGISKQLTEGNIKYGTIEEHLETEIALHRIGIKGVNVGLRDSLVLLDKQGKQGQDLIKLMAEFSAKGASQETLEKMAKGIADVSENTATQARASIRALEQLADVEGVLSVMGLDDRIIKGLTDVTVGWAPQHAIAMGKVFKELLAAEDPAKLDLYGLGGVADKLREGFTLDELTEMMREMSTRVPEEFGKFMESSDFRTFGTFAATFGGDFVNSLISVKAGFDAQARGQKWQENNEPLMRLSVRTYGESLVFAADTIHNAIMTGSVPAMKNLRDNITNLNDTLLTNLPNFAASIENIGGSAAASFINVLRAVMSGVGWTSNIWGADDMRGTLEERFPGVEENLEDSSLRREASRYEKFYGEDMPDIQTRSDERSDLAVMIGSEIKKALLEIDRSRATGQQPQVA